MSNEELIRRNAARKIKGASRLQCTDLREGYVDGLFGNIGDPRRT